MNNEEESYPYTAILDIDKLKILSEQKKISYKETRLSQLREYFLDREALEKILSEGRDPVVYKVYASLHGEQPGELDFGLTVIFPGTVGREFYFTRGHFHTKNVAEVYFGLRGTGLVLMLSPDGKFQAVELRPNTFVHIPRGWGHRAVNIGNEKFVFIAVLYSDSGYDYKTIREYGFPKIVIKSEEGYSLIPNPRYKKS